MREIQMGMLPSVTFEQNQKLFIENAAREKRREAYLKRKMEISSNSDLTKTDSSGSLNTLPESRASNDSYEKKVGNKNLVFNGGDKKVLDGIAKAFRSM
jgi:hypothetical protein